MAFTAGSSKWVHFCLLHEKGLVFVGVKVKQTGFEVRVLRPRRRGLEEEVIRTGHGRTRAEIIRESILLGFSVVLF